MKQIEVTITFKPLVERVIIHDETVEFLAKRGETPEHYALNVAQERLADNLREEAYEKFYHLAEFRLPVSQDGPSSMEMDEAIRALKLDNQLVSRITNDGHRYSSLALIKAIRTYRGLDLLGAKNLYDSWVARGLI